MKKNVMMRLASIMMVLVLMTSSVISGTFAKYVTSGESSDSARVAKWGVTIDADYSGLFNTQYATTKSWTGDDGVSVNAASDVVAPGTNVTLDDFVIGGEPEVDVCVTYVADLDIGDNWMVDADNNNVAKDSSYVRDTFYCPIIVTVNASSFNGLNYKDADAFEAAVEGEIEKATKYYNAGNALKDNVANDLAVSWQWAFDKDATGGIAANNDQYDTQLGDAAVTLIAPTISLTVQCTVTQVD